MTRRTLTQTKVRWDRSALFGLLFGLATAAAVAAQPPQAEPLPGLWGPSTPPRALLLIDDRVIVGGDFDYVGPPTGSFAVADAATGRITTPAEPVAGSVIDLTSDGAGGWYVLHGRRYPLGGTSLVHLRADGTVDPAWTAPTTDRHIAGVLRAGSHVFIRGNFASVNGVSRYGIAALDPASGAVRSWDAQLRSPFPDEGVLAWAEDGGRLIVGGAFDTAGGLPRQALAVLDTVTGATLPSAFPATVWFNVGTISAAGGRVYLDYLCGADLCGYSIDGTPLPGWRLYSLFGQRGPRAVTSNRIYVAGLHGSDPAYRIRAFDAQTGEALPWQTPPLDPFLGVQDLVVDGDRLIAVGNLTSIGNRSGSRVVAFDLATGTPLPWRPQVGGTVTRVCVDGGQVALGGDFASAGGIEKRGLAAIDLRTGRLAAQQPPDVEVRVDALARTGDVVVAGGGSRLVAFAASNGAPIGNATIVGTVSALAFSDATLYIGGSFASLFGTPRRNLGAIDLLTGRVTAWDPRPADQVTRLIESSGAIYAIGLFQSVPGYGRDGVAAYDTRDGTLLPFSASADGPINDLAFFRDRVMVAGAVSRNIYDAGTKWVDRASGEDVPLGRPVPFLANAVGRSGNTIVVGGPPSPGFSNAGLAAIDAVSGTRLAWSPRLTGVSWPFVQAIAGSTRYVAIGGAFEAVDGRPAQNLVVYPSGRVAAPQRMTTAVSRSTVTLGWQAEPAATGGYVIEAGTAPGAADVGTFAIGNATRATASLPSGTYFVRVSAVGTTGPGLASSEVVVTVPGGSTAPEAPTGLTAVVLDDIVTLRWTAAAGNATTYLIEAATSSAPTTPTAFVTGHLDTTLTTMAPRGSYVVRVRAANAFGVSPPSNEVAVVVP